jgi:hypothetical protein
MSKQEQIYNWFNNWTSTTIQIDFRKYSIMIKETIEFFSILVTDYFIFDENLNVAKATTTNYTKEDLEILIDRIRRIENKDVAIISLPRLGNPANVDHTRN